VLFVVGPVAAVGAAAVVVDVFAVAGAFVFFELTFILCLLVRPFKQTLPFLHIIKPLTIISPSIRPPENPPTFNRIINKIALENTTIT